MNKNDLHIIGAGALGQHIAHYAKISNKFASIYFFDDYIPSGTKNQYGSTVGKINQVKNFISQGLVFNLLIGIGYKHMSFRNKLFVELMDKVAFPNIIHDSCYIDNTVNLGVGNIILPGCVIDYRTEIGNNIFLNPGCIIAHDNKINDNSFFGPGVKTSGYVTIGKNCFIGTGTTTVDNISLCDNIYTGAGTIIIDNLIEPGLYVGAPSKLIKRQTN